MKPFYTADNVQITVGMTVYHWDTWDRKIFENQVASVAPGGKKVNFVDTRNGVGARVDVIYAKRENCPHGL